MYYQKARCPSQVVAPMESATFGPEGPFRFEDQSSVVFLSDQPQNSAHQAGSPIHFARWLIQAFSVWLCLHVLELDCWLGRPLPCQVRLRAVLDYSD